MYIYNFIYNIIFYILFNCHFNVNLTSLKAKGNPKIPAPMKEIKMLPNILILLFVPSSFITLMIPAFLSPVPSLARIIAYEH